MSKQNECAVFEHDVPVAAPSGDINAILTDESLSDVEKRQLLASLASDRHAVDGQPALRRGDDGVIHHIDELLQALTSLDRAAEQGGGGSVERRPGRDAPTPLRRPVRDVWFVNRSKRHGPDDDDDPPPCPASGRPFGPAPVDRGFGALAAA